MTYNHSTNADEFRPLAIVGMACHLPCATSEEAFWTMLMEGRVNYTELSEDRLNQSIYFDSKKGALGKTYGKIGAANDFRSLEPDLRKIDNIFQLEDQGFLLAHSVALQACRNAGYSVECFPHKNTGVFMGFTRGSSLGCDRTFAQNVDHVVRHLNEIGVISALPLQRRSRCIERIIASLQADYAKALSADPNKLSSILAARSIAAALDLDGQAMIMDAACSSSLSALAIAARSLTLGKIDAAIVGGASYFSFDSLVLFSKAQSISNKMSCPFDHRADGLICGEGHVFFVIKTLRKALEDGDRIRAVIRGIGVSSDGKGKSLWAPRKEGQIEAIRRAYRSGADPQRLRFVEGHLTSTPLGDLTEISAINEAYREIRPQGKQILIGGVKANVGHALEASGLVALAKALLVLEHKVVPRQINLEKLNGQFDWANGVLKVPMEPMPLQPADVDLPIQVSANSFGIGGLNVHVVLEEFNAESENAGKNVVVSGSKRKTHSPEKSVAVIGMGCLFPGANGVSAYWNLVHGGSDPKTECPASAWDKMFFRSENDNPGNTLLGGYVTNWKYDWKEHKIPPNQIARANPLQFMILDAVDQAFKDSGYKGKEFDRRRTSVVVGTTFDSDFSVALQMGIQLPEIVDAIEKTMQDDGMKNDDIEKAIADYQKIIFERYPALLDETGSFTASTLASRITKSFDLMGGAVTVDSGNVSSMAALDTAVDMIRSGESGMVVCVGAQRSTSVARCSLIQNKCLATNNLDPLDVDADGYYPGEGVGVVILKSLDQAKADGDHVYAVIHDVSCSADKDQVDASARSIRTSLQRSALSGEDIALLETSFGISHKNRRRALTSWGRALSAAHRRELALGSVFAQIGHLGGASGMASLIKAILVMQHRESPEIFGTKNLPEPGFSRTSKQLEPRHDGRLFSVVLNADAMDEHGYGISYSVLLERGVPVERTSRKTTQRPMTHAKEAGVPRLRAFLFPGQGSQYKEMLRPLADASEDCREILAGLDATLRRLDYPTFSEMAWGEIGGTEKGGGLGKDVFHTQLSLLVADTLFFELLRKFVGVPDLVLGHSYGEYPALVAANAWDFETAAIATRARCDAIDMLSTGRTGMLSTNASVDRLQEIFRTIASGRLYISNRNSQEQVVVSGDNDALSELDGILKREKRLSLRLPVPAGFHSPLVDGVKEPLKNALEQLPIRFPARPFLSSVSGRFEAEPETIRENLVEQMVRPVDFVALLQKARQYGVRQFIEVGPRTVLSNLAKKVFAEQDVEIIHCDLSKATGREMLDHLRKTAARLVSADGKEKTMSPSLGSTRDSGVVRITKDNTEIKSKELSEGFTLVECCGTPYQIGYDIGNRFQREVRGTLHRYADTVGQYRFSLPNFSSALEDYERFFDNDTLQELRGLAEGAGVPIRALLRHNLSAYQPTTGLSGRAGVYFAGTLDSGGFVHGANVDVPLYRLWPGPHHDLFQVRRPEGRIPHVLATGAGLLGGIWGINATGLCVTTTPLSEFPWDFPNATGILPLFLLGRILAESRTAEEAVELLKTSRKAGAWSFGLSELNTPKIVRVEYRDDSISLRENIPYMISADHSFNLECRTDEKAPLRPVHSVARYERLKALLHPNGRSLGCSVEAAFKALRDQTDPVLGRASRHRTQNTLWRIDNTFSILVDAGEGVVRLATTDITRTDAPDDPKRHSVIPLVQLLPELETVLAAPPQCAPKKQEIHATDGTVSREEYIRCNTSRDGKNPNPSPTLFERHVLRRIETPRPNVAASTIHGNTLIIADETNQVARSLAERLSRSGGTVLTIASKQEPDNVKDILGNIWKTTPISHLVFLSPHDPSAKTELDGDFLDHRYDKASITPLVVLREWVPFAVAHFGNLEQCTVLGATSSGGDFGITNAPFAVESGAVSGLLKGLWMEFATTANPIRVKVVDHSQTDTPDDIADDLFRETHHWDNDWEVGYSNRRRFVLRSLPLPLETNRSLDNDKNNTDIKPVWLITGGARGITAAVAATLGKRFRAKLHLIGSSPLPVIDEKWATFSAEELKDLRKQIFREAVSRKEVPVKAWEKIEKAIEIARNLRTLQNEKIDFTYHSCDMTDADAVHRLMQKIIDEDRHITGIIHGAGFEAASRLEKKKNGNVRRTLDVKVKGAILLLKALKTLEVKPEYFIGFSSVSGRFGGVGQTDYCMANDMLAKLLDWNSVQNPSCRSVCFHWPAWGEIGMAVRPESKLALESAGLAFMPLSEGIAHLLNEIEFWGGEREILIVDWNYYKRFYPDDVSVPPIVGHEIVSKTCEETRSRRFILHGADADADALFKGLTARGADVGFNDNADDGETKRTETHIITTLRDPLGACIFGVNHWKARTATSLRNTLDLCKKLLTTNSENGNTRELVLLTATDFSNSTFFPEGFIIADILRTLFDAITQDALPIIRVLDFAADDSPKTVAEGTLRLLDSPCSPGAVTINRWEGQWKKLDIDQWVNVDVCDIGKIDQIRNNEKGEWIVVVPRMASIREVECVDDRLKMLINETSRLGVGVHVCADSTFDPSEMEDVDCNIYRRSGDTEADWAEMLQKIRKNASAISGVILMTGETNDRSLKSHERLFKKVEEVTNMAVALTSLTKKDDLRFAAVLPVFPDGETLHSPIMHSATALLKTMSLQSKRTKVFVIQDKERTQLVPRENRVDTSQKSIRTEVQTTTWPLVDSIEKTKICSFVAKGRFHPVLDTFLIDHRLNGKPILPMVVILECFLETLKMAGEVRLLKGTGGKTSIEDLKVHQGFVFRSEKSCDYYVAGTNGIPAGSNRILLTMYGDYYNVLGQRVKTDKDYSSAVIRFDDDAKGCELNFPPVSDHWYDTQYPDEKAIQMYHGPSFRRLGQMHYLSGHQVIARVNVPDPMDVFLNRKSLVETFGHLEQGGNTWAGMESRPVLNAAVLDAALYACGILHWSAHQGVCIPSRIKKIVFGPGRLRKGEVAQVHIEERRPVAENKSAVFDFTIRCPRGDVVYDVTEYLATVLKMPREILEKNTKHSSTAPVKRLVH